MKKNSITSILVLLSLLLLSQPSFTSSKSNIIEISCKKAAKTDPYVDYKLCLKTLNSDPNTKTAVTSLKDLAVISTKQTVSNGMTVSSVISGLLNGQGKTKSYSISCLKACSELYYEAVSDMKLALLALGRGDYDTANTKMSAAMDAPISCEDGYAEKEGEVSPLTEINNLFFQLAAISLAFINLCH